LGTNLEILLSKLLQVANPLGNSKGLQCSKFCSIGFYDQRCMQGGGEFGVNLRPGACYFTKTLLPAQRRLIVFAYFLLCRLNANTTE